MWSFCNPVKIHFGIGAFANLPKLIGARPYALITYGDQTFRNLANNLQELSGSARLVYDQVIPNPDFNQLGDACEYLKNANAEVIIALGGGSVIDTAKVLAVGMNGFEAIKVHLASTGKSDLPQEAIPIIAVPTTAGTGSEVTKWATVWDTETSKKYSLSRFDLYPSDAVIDPELMVNLPRDLTIATGLDALSHALESIWNINANPISDTYAITAAKKILVDLPKLIRNPVNIDLRESISQAAILAGLAFSNTRTALAHSLSYPATLHYGVPHGIACSFILPEIMRVAIGANPRCDWALSEIFGDDLQSGSSRLETFIRDLGISTSPNSYGIKTNEWKTWIDNALTGERGQNFIVPSELASKALNFRWTNQL
tara:strand:+ start:120 stop:1235 length:1116 start_codon:yes stop_codon:yes gene_type:complete